jgi:hypothetical protein
MKSVLAIPFILAVSRRKKRGGAWSIRSGAAFLRRADYFFLPFFATFLTAFFTAFLATFFATFFLVGIVPFSPCADCALC